MANQGVVYALQRIAAEMKARTPCDFYFGPAENHRTASGPKIVWTVKGGNRDQTTYDREETDTSVFASDMVEVVARANGGRARAPAQLREAEYDTSELLITHLRWVLCRFHNGAYEEVGWQPLSPDGPEESGYPIELTFRIRVDVLAPPALEVVPESVEDTYVLES